MSDTVKPRQYVIPDWIKNDLRFRIKLAKILLQKKPNEKMLNAKLTAIIEEPEQRAVVIEPEIGHLSEMNLAAQKNKPLEGEAQAKATVITEPRELSMKSQSKFERQNSFGSNSNMNKTRETTLAVVDFIYIDIEGFTYKCEAKSLRSNSVWFQRQSDYIQKFTFTELEVPVRGFEKAHEWVHNQIVSLGQNNLVDVLQVSRFLEIDALNEKCWDLLMEPYFIDVRAFHVYKLALKYDLLQDVCQAMLKRIGTYFLPMIGSFEFLHLDVDDLVLLLKSDSIGVNSEMEVFYAAIRWLNYNQNQRFKHMNRVMATVRYGNLSMDFIQMLLEHFEWKIKEADFRNVAALSEFINENSRKSIVENGLHYVRSKHENLGNASHFKELCKKNQWKICAPRRWVYDPKCKYHNSDMRISYQNKVTYVDFVDYVKKLQEYKNIELHAIRIVGD